ncbi:IS110 family transposase [Streptomyces scabiei]|uniref:IS110 family transposase n=1 Tax=Streptomyces scabiei TaxID=1930 RepID=UPI001F1677D0|nr:IS110 family transposase [Streptomyces scabiei]
MPEIWAAVDIGETHHHAMVINRDGERLRSRRVLNDESKLLELIGDVRRYPPTCCGRSTSTTAPPPC